MERTTVTLSKEELSTSASEVLRGDGDGRCGIAFCECEGVIVGGLSWVEIESGSVVCGSDGDGGCGCVGGLSGPIEGVDGDATLRTRSLDAAEWDCLRSCCTGESRGELLLLRWRVQASAIASEGDGGGAEPTATEKS